MTYSSKKRDRYRVAVTAVTGLTVAGTLTSAGWIAGAAAQDYEASQSTQQPDRAAAATPQTRASATHHEVRRAAPRVVLRQRPTRVRTTTRYVAGATSAAVGGGGSVGSTPTGQTGVSSAPVSHTPPAPVHHVSSPPPPPPAHTSGS